MLVQITHRCQMECSHCFVDATPDGRHMTWGTFCKVADWVETTGFKLMMVSGGEPTEHPEILRFLEELKRREFAVLLLSNGSFLTESPELRDKILPLVNMVQVTNDDRFYPKRIGEFKHPKVAVENRLRIISPVGRAKTNKLESSLLAPLCFNLRSLNRARNDFSLSIACLRGMHKFCTPMIDVDGAFHAGESQFCSSFGNVTDSNAVLTKNLRKLRCSRCGLVDQIRDDLKNAIGEVP